MSAGCPDYGTSGSAHPLPPARGPSNPCLATQGAAAGSAPLTTLKPGQTARVTFTNLDADDAALLRAMGLRLSARIRLCRLGEPCIVEVLSGRESCNRPGGCACRIGLARPLAERVLVGVVEGG